MAAERVFGSSTGRKFDGGKLEYGLLPPFALERSEEHTSNSSHTDISRMPSSA